MTSELVERLICHVEQVCENPGDDDRSVLTHNFRTELTAQLAEARQAERAAVVAWLNNGALFKEHVGPGTLAMFRSMITAIEAREHLA